MTQQVNWKQNNVIWGVLLVAGGLFLLLQNFGFLSALTAMIWVMLFGAAGLVFLYLFLNHPQERWWSAIPGCTLLGLAMVIGVSELGPRFLAPLGGSLFLFSIGAGFALVYLTGRERWWALIPAGVMTTLALVAGVDQFNLRWIDPGGLFLIGLGLTFFVVALFPRADGKERRWALIPGAILLGMGLLIGTSLVGALNYVWPLVLIVGGGVLIWRQLNTQHS